MFRKNRFSSAQIRRIERVRKGGSLYKIEILIAILVCIYSIYYLFFDYHYHYGISDLIMKVICVLSIIFAIYVYVKTKLRVRKWNKYHSIISFYGNTELEHIAKEMKKTEDEVCNDLKVMIKKNLLAGPDYLLTPVINRNLGLLVMVHYKTGQELEPVDDYFEQKTIKENEEKIIEIKNREKREAKDIWAKRNELIENGEGAKVFRSVATQIKDVNIQKSVLGVATSIEHIENIIGRHPEYEDIATVQKYRYSYIDDVIKLLKVYLNGRFNEDDKENLIKSFEKCTEVFGNIEKMLVDRENMETMIEIEVMENTFRRDGLLNSDFDIFN